MTRHAEVPITVVRENGVVREVWAEDAHGHAVPLAIKGFSLDTEVGTEGEAVLRFNARRVRIEDR